MTFIFFAIKMELWQIWESNFAPKFQIISKPNDWAKAIKKSTNKSALSDMKLLQLDFWNKFKEYIENTSFNFKLRKANPQHWYTIRIWISNAQIDLTINSQSNQIACEIYISNSKELFYSLEKEKENIENNLNMKLEWMPLENKKASRIKISFDADINNFEKWDNYFELLWNTAFKFQKTFLNEINKIRK